MERMNVQANIRAYLASNLPDVSVKVSIPDPRPDYLVVVRRVGGSMQDALIDVPKIEALIYAPTEAETAKLATLVSQLMFKLTFADGYAQVYESFFYSDYDTVAKNPRWYAQYELKTYLPKE